MEQADPEDEPKALMIGLLVGVAGVSIIPGASQNFGQFEKGDFAKISQRQIPLTFPDDGLRGGDKTSNAPCSIEII